MFEVAPKKNEKKEKKRKKMKTPCEDVIECRLVDDSHSQ
jgi:hypothetical protein